MSKIKPIRIFHGDDEKGVRQRHEEIVARLEEIGQEGVRTHLATGGLPTQWGPVIQAWMRGDELEDDPEKKAEKAPEPGEG